MRSEKLKSSPGDPITMFSSWMQKPFASYCMVFLLGELFLIVSYSTDVFFSSSSCEKGYLSNISWSLTMLTIFPIVFVFKSQFENNKSLVISDIEKMSSTNIPELHKYINRIFTSKKLLLTYSAMPVLWYFYFTGLLESNSWVWRGCNSPKVLTSEIFNHISLLGYLTTITHVILAASVLFIVRSVIYGHTIYKHIKTNNIKLNAFHPDGVYGLNQYKKQINLVIRLIWFLGLYVIIYLLDKMYIQNEIVDSLSISMFYILCFIVANACIYLFTIKPFHDLMKSTKSDVLDPLQSALLNQSYPDSLNEQSKNNQTYNLFEMQEKYSQMKSTLPDELIEFNAKPKSIIYLSKQLLPPVFTVGIGMVNFFKNL